MASPKHSWKALRAVGVEQIENVYAQLEVQDYEIHREIADGPQSLIIVAKRPLQKAR